MVVLMDGPIAAERGGVTLVLVTGPPASGKTSLAQPLARHLGLPLLGKDTIKEVLFDSLGTGDRAWSRRLGAASYAVLLELAGSCPLPCLTPTSTRTTAQRYSRHVRDQSRCSAAAR